MNFSLQYKQEDYFIFLKSFLPDFVKDTRKINLNSSFQSTEDALYLGRSEELELDVYEIRIKGKTEKKISQALESFRIIKQHLSYRALIVYYSNSDKNWRLALLQMTPELSESGKRTNKFSNPRRFSFLLGPFAKINTPKKYIIDQGSVKNFSDLEERFSVEVVNKDFYFGIADLFSRLTGGDRRVRSKKIHYKTELFLPSVDHNNKKVYQEFAVRLIGRIIFCWFLKQKKSIKNISLLPDEYISVDAVKINENYYHKKLETIFFEVFNKPVDQRKSDLKDKYERIPYLNGGLFDPHIDDFYDEKPNYALKIPDQWFTDFFEFLGTYNFTIDENSILDTDLSIDPEMLGRIFENLLAEINPATGDSARKATGSYYTPRQIVDYMVEQSLIQYLTVQTKINKNKIKALISVDEEDDFIFPLDDNDRLNIISALDKLKIIDPACGSGAFPIGILQKIVWILGKIDRKGKLWFEKKLAGLDPILHQDFKKKFENENFDYIRKTGVIRDTIYGVDIQAIAVEVSKLRCFLTLIVDEEIDDNDINRGIKPLPNLEFKFVAANTLVHLPGSFATNNGQMEMFESNEEINELKKIRDRYFVSNGTEKEKCKIDFDKTRIKMFQNQRDNNFKGSLTNALADWDPFKNESSNWFDPEWMFGVNKFDIVIANPPYISYGLRGTQKLSTEEKKNICTTFPNSAEYKISLYALFMDKAIQLAGNNGIQTYIVPDSFLLGRYYSKIRLYILKNCEIEHISWLPYKIFEATVGFSVIYTFVKKDSLSENHKINARLIISNNQVLDGSFCEFSYSQKYFNDLKHNRFRMFFNKQSMILINKIEAQSEELCNFMTGRTGVRSLIGQKNIIGKEKKNKFWQAGLISGSQILKYSINYKYDFLNIDPSKLNKGGWDYNIIHNPKLLLRQTADNLIATIDYNGYYHLNNIHSFALDNKQLDILFILSIINSKLINYYYKIISLESGRVMAQTDIESIESLPIKKISQAEQKPFIEIVNKILTITKPSGYLENQEKQTKVKEYEKQIDQMVYKLYDLTPEEIKIVEGENGKY